MEIPTIVKSNNGRVFFLQLSRFSHQYDAKLQPIFDGALTLSWHDGFDLSFEYQDIMVGLITDFNSEFQVCRSEHEQIFMVGSAIPYFDFCHWVDGIHEQKEFDSVKSLFSEFVVTQQIQPPDYYQHPSWLEDIFWLLNFNSSPDNPITKQQIVSTIQRKRQTYFRHYPHYPLP